MANEEKIEELQEILREDPQNFQARRELAILLIDAGFPKEAAQHLLYLAKTFPDDSAIYYNLGIAYEKQKEFKKAQEAYLKCLEIAPQEIDAVYNLGLVYTELQKYDEGIKCFKKVLQQDSNDSNSYFNIGICYFKKVILSMP